MDDADRELAGRRRDLEREFDAKMRDLKSQTKRLAESLEQDRREWEERRRAQQKELADREEKVRRREDNREKAAEAKAATQDDVAALRGRVQELEAEKLKAKGAQERLEQRAAAAERRFRFMRTLVWFVLGPLTLLLTGWVIVALQDDGDVGLAVTSLAVALGFCSLAVHAGRR